jgi:WD40 repeat protein
LEQADGISLYSPTLNADRHLVAAASPSGIRFWDLQTLDEVATIPGAFSSIAFSRDGRTLLVRSDVFQIWHVSSSEE